MNQSATTLKPLVDVAEGISMTFNAGHDRQVSNGSELLLSTTTLKTVQSGINVVADESSKISNFVWQLWFDLRLR